MAETIEGVDTAKIPGSVLAEFGKREFDSKTKGELDAMEAQINSVLSGSPVLPAPTPTPSPGFSTPTPMRSEVIEQVPVNQPDTTQKVPAKFAKPDGTLDQEKLEKSYVSLEDYLAKERELTKLRMQAAQIADNPFIPSPYPNVPYPNQTNQIPLSDRVNEDMRNDPGATVVNMMRAAVLMAQQQSAAQTSDLQRRLELMEIGQKDPAVFTKEGFERLAKIRAENPWLDYSPTPWLHAYKMSGYITRNAPEVPQVNANGYPSIAQRTSAPILPGGQSPSIPSGPMVYSSEAELRRALEAKFPKNPQAQADALERILKDQEARRA